MKVDVEQLTKAVEDYSNFLQKSCKRVLSDQLSSRDLSLEGRLKECVAMMVICCYEPTQTRTILSKINITHSVLTVHPKNPSIEGPENLVNELVFLLVVCLKMDFSI